MKIASPLSRAPRRLLTAGAALLLLLAAGLLTPGCGVTFESVSEPGRSRSESAVTQQNAIPEAGEDDLLIDGFAGATLENWQAFGPVGVRQGDGALAMEASGAGGPDNYHGFYKLLPEAVNLTRRLVMQARIRVTPASSGPAKILGVIKDGNDIDANRDAAALTNEIPADGTFRTVTFNFEGRLARFDGAPVDATRIVQVIFLVNPNAPSGSFSGEVEFDWIVFTDQTAPLTTPPAGAETEPDGAATVAGTTPEPSGPPAPPALLGADTRGPVTDDLLDSDAFLRAAQAAGAPGDLVTDAGEARIDALLAEMTLEEKVGQMTQVTLEVITENNTSPQRIAPAKLREALETYHVGSVLNIVDAAFPVAHWQDLITQIQDAAAGTRLGIPVFYGIDAVHGANYTREAVLFPQNIGLGATWNPALAQATARVTARDVRASGIPWNFAPVLDVGREPRWARLYETFGEDVHLATVLGTAMVRGYQGDALGAPDRVAACLKHYVGYSSPASGRDRTPVLMTDATLRELYLPPFEAAVEAGAATVMVNSGELNGVPVHTSRTLLTDVLRGELGFEGLVVSDWEDIKKLVTIHHVAEDEREATKMAVLAGVDMSMVPTDFSFHRTLVALVEDGEVPVARIDEAVRRILRVKLATGLFDDPNPGRALAADVGRAADRRLSLQAARESIVLLRNEGGVLPLQAGQRVLVTGPTAHAMQPLHGGWTYTWQGGGQALEMFPAGRPTILEALQAGLGPENVTYVPGATLDAPEGLAAAVAAAGEADVAVVALGEGAYTEIPGNIASLELPAAQQTLLERVAATGTPVVLVLAQGRPRVIGPGAEEADAILVAPYPGPEGGQAVAEVLRGAVNPSGHLPYTYPRDTAVLPTYDRKHSLNQDVEFGMSGFTPLFVFGDGLSYTTFEVSNLTVGAGTLDADALADGGLPVEVTLTNTGRAAGKDVVQLYVSDLTASVTPRVRQLKRFAKVHLEPGEARTLTFTLREDDLAVINRDGERVVEAGRFRLTVGAQTASFRLTSSLRLSAVPAAR